ncbi:bacteriohemerythrin [Clostridium beijerinckii]|uniref:Bacteriohemerythrin n=1 Tax=Clostridium beijerinckii TaxID=1520 RepID=A0A1S9N6Q0_CLOBE|nr:MULTISPECIES: hemerythrin family protein [Clostridium]MZK52609.1 bacteriohemerythrin [Clostridium beijerinckii]MZK60647.1 bacteriohemerythrin [Clostridium beijerinckii]MZK70922.1 bacteriohemerythrin [Clostridium beijerinckii]MZK76277.1 bacteriohemerythrin [Clostridium beijerinckii]MZK85942.1 bacteriohemerythrin [Clostridium beijerinckii]
MRSCNNFKKEYKIGIDFIDDQHRFLFELADKTYNLLTNEFSLDKYDKIMGLIDELKSYTVLHFNAEEDYMKSINYKRMFSQKVEHDAFIKKLNEVDFRLIDENQDAAITEILKFLNDWLTEHFRDSDMLIGK